MARRIPVVTREEVAPEHQAAYDEIAGIRGRPPVVGPSSVMVHSPEMAVRVNRLSEFLGESAELPETFKRWQLKMHPSRVLEFQASGL